MDCIATRLFCPWDFPGKDTGVGGIFPTEGLNPHLLRWQVDSLSQSHLGSPFHHPSQGLFSFPILPVLHSHFLFSQVAWTFWGWLRNFKSLKIPWNYCFSFLSIFLQFSFFPFEFFFFFFFFFSNSLIIYSVSFSLITFFSIPWFRSSAKNWTHVTIIPGLGVINMREFLCLATYKNNLESFVLFYFKIIYLFIWLCCVLVAACGIFDLSCST